MPPIGSTPETLPEWSDIVRIGNTAYGKGVFARQRFPKGFVLGRVHGEVINIPNYDSNYCIDLGGDKRLEPASPFRFVNHCCEPSCRFIYYVEADDDDTRPEEIYLETLRVIEPGEQLSIDYAWPADAAIPCGCRRPKCRGWIVAEAELTQLHKNRAAAAAESA